MADSSRDDPLTHGNTRLTANEYAESVRQWITQYNMWHQTCLFQMTFPYYMMGYMAAQSQPQTTPSSQSPQNATLQVQRAPAGQARRLVITFNRSQNVQREFKIPSIWKRFMAEFIDFFLLFILKLAVTIVVVEYLGLIDLDQYEIDLDQLFNQDLELNYTIAFNMTSELVALEILNRAFITLFEAMCLRRGVAGTVGGATPGKRFMGIFVVSSEGFVTDLGNGRVQITPAGNIGFWNALVRSIIKNFSLAFFFPVCFTALFFQHHRAAYDVIANCVVVEPIRNRNR